MSSIRRRLALGFAVCAGLSALCSPPARATVLLPVGFEDEVRADSLDKPTSLAFLPDGRVLVTEQWSGNIRLVTAGSSLVPSPMYTFPDVTQNYERGLLSIAVDPGWPIRPFIYCHYTAVGDISRLVRLTGLTNLSDPTGTALRFGRPLVLLDSLPDVNPWHNGGASRFGPDGMLYLSLGDDGEACLSQDSTTLHGCILRLDVSGLSSEQTETPPRDLLAAPGNPYASSPDSNAHLEYAIGFRNPFRYQIDPATGLLYVSDVGENTWEELDQVTAGANAGWPHREALDLVDYPYCSEPGGLGANSYLTPIDLYEHPQGAVIVCAGVVRHARVPTLWPAGWEGNVLYADFMEGWMRMIHPEVDGTWTRIATGENVVLDFFATGLKYPTDFAWGPDGNLWWLSYGNDYWDPQSGSLHRMYSDMFPAAVGADRGRGPVLRAWPNPARGPVGLSASLGERRHVRLEVLDIEGRLVTTLIDGERGPGPVFASWDGRNDQGRPLPSGVYLVRLQAGGTVTTTRVVRVR